MMAYRDFTIEEYNKLKKDSNDFKAESDREVLENDLISVIVFALKDPLRPEIVQSVKLCREAGINIRMVTGDNLETAKAIAIEAGIITSEEAQ